MFTILFFIKDHSGNFNHKAGANTATVFLPAVYAIATNIDIALEFFSVCCDLLQICLYDISHN